MSFIKTILNPYKWPREKRVFTKQLFLSTERWTLFDVGCRDADSEHEYLDILHGKNYNYHGFDADAAEIHRLTEYANNHVFFSNVAIADSNDGFLYFHPNQDDIFCSTVSESESEHKVSVITVDSYCKENNINYIDELKIDIEGGSKAALQGCQSLLKSKSISLIDVEIILDKPNELLGVVDILSLYGYQLYSGQSLSILKNKTFDKHMIAKLELLDLMFVQKDVFLEENFNRRDAQYLRLNHFDLHKISDIKKDKLFVFKYVVSIVFDVVSYMFLAWKPYRVYYRTPKFRKFN